MEIFVFILWFALAEVVLSFAQFLLRKKQIKPWLRALIIVLKLLVAVVFAALVMAGPVQLRKIQPFMMGAYVALLADGVFDIIYCIIVKIKHAKRKFASFKIGSLAAAIAFLAFGILNMQIVTPHFHSYSSSKINKEHKIAFLADLHVGSAQPFDITKKTIESVKAEQPECLILGGDITDDYTTKDEMQKTFELFGKMNFPVYYVYGNHDRQGHAEYANGLQYSPEEFEQAMEDNGIVILKDEFVQIDDDLLLLGREDITEGDGRAKIETLNNPNKDAYLIVADHQPVEFEQNLAIGTNLQLSGHTHAGQLFPLKWLYSLIGGYVYDDYEIDGSILNVSSGACGWRMPLRTDAQCNFEIITLKP